MRFLFLFFILCSLTDPLKAEIKNGDFQFWNQWSLDKKFKNEKWKSRYVGELRWEDHASRLYLAYFQAQLVYTKKWLEIAPGYRQEYNNPNDRWETLYAPLSDITFFLSKKWELEDRNRIIYHIPAHAASFIVYRNRLRLTSPQLWSYFNFKFFVDDEVFFMEDIGLQQNRFSIGLLATPKSFLLGRISYMYRNLKEAGTWKFQNVLSLQIHFNY